MLYTPFCEKARSQRKGRIELLLSQCALTFFIMLETSSNLNGLLP
jgi:hypothetical protein